MLHTIAAFFAITTRLPAEALPAGLIFCTLFACASSYSCYYYARRGRIAVR